MNFACASFLCLQKETLNVFLLIPGSPETPTLTLSWEIIENKYTLDDRVFQCSGQVGYPNAGTLEIESNFDGTFAQLYLAPDGNTDKDTAKAFMTKLSEYQGSCLNSRTLKFAFHNISADMHNKRLRCIVRPPADAANGSIQYSSSQVMKVASGKYSIVFVFL